MTLRAHYFEQALFGGQFFTEECRRLFDERAMIQHWLDVEAALAAAQAEVGVISQEAAETIAAHARVELLDMVRVQELAERTAHPLVAVLRELAAACGVHGEVVHLGATTQDIWDTADVLRLRAALDIVERDLRALIAVLADLALAHRDTPMAGRTHGQQAVPLTFGYKVALWIAELRRHLDRLMVTRTRCLVGQLSGAVGTSAGFGDQAPRIQALTLARLGLAEPTAPWHCARDTMAEIGAFAALVGGTLARMASEVIILGSTEIGELAEPFDAHHVGSSAMPHKRNPETCEAIVVAARLLRDDLGTVLDGMVQRHERDGAAWTGERVRLPEMACLVCGALHCTLRIMSGLVVRPERMRDNLQRHGGIVCSEALSARLGEFVGRKSAHDLLHRLATEAHQAGQSFAERVLADPEVGGLVGREELERLLDPVHHTGRSGAVVDAIVAEARTALMR